MRVAVELVHAATDEPVWAGTYDRDVRDVFALHHDVAGAISGEIALVAHPAREHAVHAETRSVEAYEAYLRGRFYWNLRSTEAAPKAIAQFNRALELDPLYAEAYIGLADTYAILGDMDAMPHADAYARAEAAARRALDLDPSRAEGYASLGHLRMHAWRWEEADRLFRRALELDPGYATALQWRVVQPRLPGAHERGGGGDRAGAAARSALRDHQHRHGPDPVLRAALRGRAWPSAARRCR